MTIELGIYFVITSCGKYFKIGHSTAPRERVEDLQYHHRYKLKLPDYSRVELLLLIREYGEITELGVHKKFKHLRVKGFREYYHASPEIFAYIEQLKPLNIGFEIFETEHQIRSRDWGRNNGPKERKPCKYCHVELTSREKKKHHC